MVHFKQLQSLNKIYIYFGEFRELVFLLICFSLYPFTYNKVLGISDTNSNMTYLITKLHPSKLDT